MKKTNNKLPIKEVRCTFEIAINFEFRMCCAKLHQFRSVSFVQSILIVVKYGSCWFLSQKYFSALQINRKKLDSY